MCDKFVRHGTCRFHGYAFKGVLLESKFLSRVEHYISKRVAIGCFWNCPTQCSNGESLAVSSEIVNQHNSFAVLNVETQPAPGVVRVHIAIDAFAPCNFRERFRVLGQDYPFVLVAIYPCCAG